MDTLYDRLIRATRTHLSLFTSLVLTGRVKSHPLNSYVHQDWWKYLDVSVKDFLGQLVLRALGSFISCFFFLSLLHTLRTVARGDVVLGIVTLAFLLLSVVLVVWFAIGLRLMAANLIACRRAKRTLRSSMRTWSQTDVEVLDQILRTSDW
ncbi:MAG: hypothetical protein ABIH41_07260 [Nanoarchaeota archaeon]